MVTNQTDTNMAIEQCACMCEIGMSIALKSTIEGIFLYVYRLYAGVRVRAMCVYECVCARKFLCHCVCHTLNIILYRIQSGMGYAQTDITRKCTTTTAATAAAAMAAATTAAAAAATKQIYTFELYTWFSIEKKVWQTTLTKHHQ